MVRSWRSVAVPLCLLAALSGCGSRLLSDGDGTGTQKRLRNFDTRFTRIAPSGYVDMRMDFSNPTGLPVTVQGRLVARDASGAELPDVTVTTAFGTESGRAVVMPAGSVDFVQLEGAAEEDVRDVTFELKAFTPVDVAVANQALELIPLDAQGQELDDDLLADRAEVTNPNRVNVHARVVLMILVASQPGVPQEASLVKDVGMVDVPAGGAVTVDLDADTRRIMREKGADGFVTLRTVVAP